MAGLKSKNLQETNQKKIKLDHIYNANCLDVLKTLPSDQINLTVTSPPYADNRKNTYEGVKIKDYVDWFLPISEQIYRVLRPDGSFILNIKERVQNGSVEHMFLN